MEPQSSPRLLLPLTLGRTRLRSTKTAPGTHPAPCPVSLFLTPVVSLTGTSSVRPFLFSPFTRVLPVNRLGRCIAGSHLSVSMTHIMYIVFNVRSLVFYLKFCCLEKTLTQWPHFNTRRCMTCDALPLSPVLERKKTLEI